MLSIVYFYLKGPNMIKGKNGEKMSPKAKAAELLSAHLDGFAAAGEEGSTDRETALVKEQADKYLARLLKTLRGKTEEA
jgi:hypothetical protein